MYFPANPQYPSPPDEKTALTNGDGPLILIKGINELREATTPYAVTLFNLEGPVSPYFDSQKLASLKVNLLSDDIMPNNEHQKTTDFFQYAFLLRNSKALTKLK